MAINRKQTVDIVEDLVSLINTELTGTSAWSDNGDGTYTISLCNTYWLNTMETVTIDSVEFTDLVVVKDTSLTVTGVSIPTALTFFLDVPSYYHGTVIQTNEEITASNPNVTARTPMVYLLEIISDDFKSDEDILERTSDLRLFFLTEADEKNWLTDEHYTDAIDPMRKMVSFFVDEVLKKSKGLGKIEEYTVTNHANFGVYTTDKGHTKKIFNDSYSGCELRITLPIMTDMSCGCDGVFSKIKYVDSDTTIKSSDYGSTIVCTPTGTVTLNVSNSDDSYDVDISTDLELPDINNIDSDGSTVVTPAQTVFTATPNKRSSEPYRSGQTTSYQTGDDGDLELGNGAGFYTLSANNPFGNTFRFTDFSGNDFATGTPVGDVCIDWATANYTDETVFIWWTGYSANSTWSLQVTGMQTEQGTTTFVTGWYLASEMVSLMAIDREISRFPTFFTSNTSDFWTSSSIDVSLAIFCRQGQSLNSRNKANGEGGRQTRLTTFAEIGV